MSGRLDHAALARREAQVARLVRDGLSERQIARALGISRTAVWETKQALKAKAAPA